MGVVTDLAIEQSVPRVSSPHRGNHQDRTAPNRDARMQTLRSLCFLLFTSPSA